MVLLWHKCFGTFIFKSACEASSLLALTMCGSWMLARLLMREWLRLASSCSSESFCCSMALFSSSMDFRLVSMVVIWEEGERETNAPL